RHIPTLSLHDALPICTEYSVMRAGSGIRGPPPLSVSSRGGTHSNSASKPRGVLTSALTGADPSGTARSEPSVKVLAVVAGMAQLRGVSGSYRSANSPRAGRQHPAQNCIPVTGTPELLPIEE